MSNFEGICVEDGFDGKDAKIALESHYGAAEKLLRVGENIMAFLEKVEERMTGMKHVTSALKSIPVLVDMVKKWVKKEYTGFPWATLVTIVAALIYFLLPTDAIPDTVPVLGHIDDAAVIALCLLGIKTDVEIYQEWLARQSNEEN